jgi:Tfp pilus assembly protein PilX
LKTKILKEGKGIVLVLALLMLLVLTLIGISALNTGTHDILISGNERASLQAFYVAEAGINEFMGRFRDSATNPITDSDQSNPNWKLLLAKNPGKGATKIGYGSGSQNYPSLQNQLDFGVEIKHKVDASSPPQVIKYGQAPIYVIKSYGFAADGGNKAIEVELKKSSGYDPPAALYSKAPVQIRGSTTYVSGVDGCPGDGLPENKPGIETTSSIIDDSIGNPTILGEPEPKITDSTNSLPLKEMMDYLSGDADFNYSYTGNKTLTGYSDGWGTPISSGTDVPITYDGPMNIIYVNMQGTNTLKLAGGSHGAGILLIDGNLEINGGFTWYGVILVTGSVDYTGGGEKNVTGGIIAGEDATVEVDIGGNSGIIYCSKAIDKLKSKVPPHKVTKWREIF